MNNPKEELDRMCDCCSHLFNGDEICPNCGGTSYPEDTYTPFELERRGWTNE